MFVIFLGGLYLFGTLLQTSGSMAVVCMIGQTGLWCNLWPLFISYEVLHIFLLYLITALPELTFGCSSTAQET